MKIKKHKVLYVVLVTMMFMSYPVIAAAGASSDNAHVRVNTFSGLNNQSRRVSQATATALSASNNGIRARARFTNSSGSNTLWSAWSTRSQAVARDNVSRNTVTPRATSAAGTGTAGNARGEAQRRPTTNSVNNHGAWGSTVNATHGPFR